MNRAWKGTKPATRTDGEAEDNSAETDAVAGIAVMVDSTMVDRMRVIGTTAVTGRTPGVTAIDAMIGADTRHGTMGTDAVAGTGVTASTVGPEAIAVTKGTVATPVPNEADVTKMVEVVATGGHAISMVVEIARMVVRDALVKTGHRKAELDVTVVVTAVDHGKTAPRGKALARLVGMRPTVLLGVELPPMRTMTSIAQSCPTSRSVEQIGEKTRVRHGRRAGRCRRHGRSPECPRCSQCSRNTRNPRNP